MYLPVSMTLGGSSEGYSIEGSYLQLQTANVPLQQTRARWRSTLGFYPSAQYPFSECQAAATAWCFFGDLFARCATLCAGLCPPFGFTMTSINSFWAST
jgi:hypothetical protein